MTDNDCAVIMHHDAIRKIYNRRIDVVLEMLATMDANNIPDKVKRNRAARFLDSLQHEYNAALDQLHRARMQQS